MLNHVSPLVCFKISVSIHVFEEKQANDFTAVKIIDTGYSAYGGEKSSKF